MTKTGLVYGWHRVVLGEVNDQIVMFRFTDECRKGDRTFRVEICCSEKEYNNPDIRLLNMRKAWDMLALKMRE